MRRGRPFDPPEHWPTRYCEVDSKPIPKETLEGKPITRSKYDLRCTCSDSCQGELLRRIRIKALQKKKQRAVKVRLSPVDQFLLKPLRVST